jgi:uncharacterized protein (TIGR04222 family)
VGCLGWLLAMAGVGGASLLFATSTPGVAAWVLGLVVLALLTGPHVVEWWVSRSRRAERLAARWWAAGPEPIEVAFLCGGPDRVTDLVIAELVAEGRLTVGDDGKLTAAPAGAAEANGDDDGELGGRRAGGEDGFRREIFTRLSYGDADVGSLRFSARPTTATPELWRAAVRQGLLLPAWRREYTHWYVAGAVAVVGFGVAIALRGDLTLAIAVAALALGGVALWRARFLVGYGFDPRTAAGQRAVELAWTADRPGDHRHLIAVRGLRSTSDLGAAGRPVPVSHWHIPWYANRVREDGKRWWQEMAQAVTRP